MKKLTEKEGIEMFQNTWNISLNEKDNYFPVSFNFRDLRYRCFIKKPSEKNEKSLIYFHLSNEEKMKFPVLSPLPKKLYLYGAFNHMKIYQLRIYGIIRRMNRQETRGFFELMNKRMKGKNSDDSLSIKPSFAEKRMALEKIKKGNFYCFVPLDFAYNIYERG